MSDTAPVVAETAPADNGNADTADQAAKPEVDWKAKAREWEKRAKANADAATRLVELEEAQKSHEQKLADRAEAAERQATESQREIARLRVIAETQLDPDLHEFVVGETEEEMRAKALKLKAMAKAGPRFGDVDLGVRQTTPAPGGDERATARSLFQSGT